MHVYNHHVSSAAHSQHMTNRKLLFVKLIFMYLYITIYSLVFKNAQATENYIDLAQLTTSQLSLSLPDKGGEVTWRDVESVAATSPTQSMTPHNTTPIANSYTPPTTASQESTAESDEESNAFYSISGEGWDTDSEQDNLGLNEECDLIAERSGSSAQLDLASAYYFGTNKIQKNINKAIHFYKRAAYQGAAIAQHNLGICYQEGIGVKKNPLQALDWYRRAAGNLNEKVRTASYYFMGHLYENEFSDTEQHKQRAVYYYELAADGDLPEALNNLGLCYQHGIGTKKNVRYAVYLYKRAVSRLQADAMYNLAMCYGMGIGIAKDTTAAFSLLMLSDYHKCEKAKEFLEAKQGCPVDKFFDN